MESSSMLALTPVLLVVLKASAVLLLALALTALMQRASATSRHLVWVASLFALLAIPALALWSPIRFAVLPAALAGLPLTAVPLTAEPVVATPVRAVTADALPAATTDTHAARIATQGRAEEPVGSAARDARDARIAGGEFSADSGATESSLLMLVAIGWSAVAAALLGWLAYGVMSVRRIVGRATPLTAPEWRGSMIDIADRLALQDAPRLLRAAGVTMPFACGFRQPTIVLPDDCESWSSDRRSAVLLHELAHIRRHDIIGHTLGRVVCALYWFHPLAWTAARRLRAESERACDDLALSCGTRASDYAEHLLDIVTSVRSHATPSAAMAMATRSEFEGRMLAILDPSLMRTAPTRTQASTLAGGVMMFAIVAGSAVPRTAVSPSEPPQPAMAEASAPDPRRVQSAMVMSTDSADVTKVETRSITTSDTLRAKGWAGRVDGEPASQPEPMPASDARPTPDPRPRIAGPDLVPPAIVDTSARASVLARILRTDSAASLRRTAAWGLSKYTDNKAALEALLYAVRRDASPSVREMAAWALAEASDRNGVAGVLADVVQQERDRSVRETAIWALSEGSSNQSALAAVTSALGDDELSVREIAAWALGSAEPDRAPAQLIALLGDRDARVRATAAWALFQIEDATSADALEAALNREQDADVKWAMVRAISVMGERAVLPLQRIIESSDAPLRALAIRALARSQGSDPWPKPRPRPRPSP
jgi:beta-lactamase regulating signal transducer with metallopeptidase domain/HEAT repeat protein